MDMGYRDFRGTLLKTFPDEAEDVKCYCDKLRELGEQFPRFHLQLSGPRWLSYEELRQQGIFRSRMTLMRAIQMFGFPPGILLSPNCRRWCEVEVQKWLLSRPSEPRPDYRRTKYKEVAARAAAAEAPRRAPARRNGRPKKVAPVGAD